MIPTQPNPNYARKTTIFVLHNSFSIGEMRSIMRLMNRLVHTKQNLQCCGVSNIRHESISTHNATGDMFLRNLSLYPKTSYRLAGEAH